MDNYAKSGMFGILSFLRFVLSPFYLPSYRVILLSWYIVVVVEGADWITTLSQACLASSPSCALSSHLPSTLLPRYPVILFSRYVVVVVDREAKWTTTVSQT